MENARPQPKLQEIERAYLVNKILHDALLENQARKQKGEPTLPSDITNTQLTSVIIPALDEIDLLEGSANQDVIRSLTKEEAERIKIIWTLSGPGTFDMPFKQDRYKDKQWATWMDRKRLNHTARLARRITQLITGENTPPTNDLNGSLHRLKEKIYESGPFIIYNGRRDENKVVREVLSRENIVIPTSNVFVNGEGIDKSVDQVKQWRLPPGVELSTKDEIGIVTHAPHAMRLMHMINRYQPFPKDTSVRVFPLPTPREAGTEYAEDEVRGLLYYTFVSRDATPETFPYTT
jgi:hypothetical protein